MVKRNRNQKIIYRLIIMQVAEYSKVVQINQQYNQVTIAEQREKDIQLRTEKLYGRRGSHS